MPKEHPPPYAHHTLRCDDRHGISLAVSFRINMVEKIYMRRLWKLTFWAFLVIMLAIQLVKPSMTNPAVDPAREIAVTHPMTAEVTAILQRSCNDCHSNRTVWPWYSNVAPASWLVSHDVREGRDALNFSEWTLYAPQKQQKLMDEICEQVTEGEMPASQYTLLHRSARLTRTDVQAVCIWAGRPTEREAMRGKDH